jgi:hypothetical protein
MSELKFEGLIDTSDPKEVKAWLAFFQVLAGEETAKAAPKKRATKKEVDSPDTTSGTLQEKIIVKGETHAGAAEFDENVFSIDEVRTLVAAKAKAYKVEIKAKLGELDALNVSKLEAAKYPEFMEFLNALA